MARARDNVVLAVSIPASELEMTAEDQSDFERFKKLLDRLGKAIIMSAETETSEIIRRRLFEWDGLPKDAKRRRRSTPTGSRRTNSSCRAGSRSTTRARAFAATYPFHPALLSVFERKWQALAAVPADPRRAAAAGALGVASLRRRLQGRAQGPADRAGNGAAGRPLFRAAVFEQLGEPRLEAAVTTDIAGAEHAHAVRLDAEASPEVKKARLHRKVATSIFFESNGGQHRGEATLPEIRLAVAEPGLDIGNVEQCLEVAGRGLLLPDGREEPLPVQLPGRTSTSCSPTVARASARQSGRAGPAEIQKVFAAGSGVERVYFPGRATRFRIGRR